MDAITDSLISEAEKEIKSAMEYSHTQREQQEKLQQALSILGGIRRRLTEMEIR